MAETTCWIEGCERAYHARGWCKTHYARWMRSRPDRRSPVAPPSGYYQDLTEERLGSFWNYVEVGHPLGCWEWKHTRDRDGYGYLFRMGRNLRAHRVAFVLLRGSIDDAKQIDHLCRNRGCVNPDHLENVTIEENALRVWELRNGKAPRDGDRCCRGHQFD